MSIEKDISGRIEVGQSTLQVGDNEPQVITMYELPLELPTRAKKRDICIEHFKQGAAVDLIDDFNIGGIHFPEQGEPQEITTQLSCKGASCILKKCGLNIEQFDTDGKSIGSMGVEQ